MVQMRHELQDAFFRAMFIGVNSPYLVLEIRRDHIIRDALYQVGRGVSGCACHSCFMELSSFLCAAGISQNARPEETTQGAVCW